MVSAKFFEESIGAKRAKAMCAAMRKIAEVRAMAVVAARWRCLRAQEPCCGGADEEGEGGEDGGKAQGGEAGAGEVEEGGHGEGVVADAAVGEEVADVGDEGDVAGGPEAVGEGEGDGDAEDGEGGVGDGDPAAGGLGLRSRCFRRG